MYTQPAPAEIARFKVPAIPFEQPDIDFETPINARDIAPKITPVGDEQQQVHKTKLLENRRRRATRRANRR